MFRQCCVQLESAQREVPYHPWIDLLPFLRMRDNLLCAGDTFDEMELCGDLVGMFSELRGDVNMIVWGDPWNVDEWEVTETFVKNWGWTIEGCWELFESTNRWRQRRAEAALCFHRLGPTSNLRL